MLEAGRENALLAELQQEELLRQCQQRVLPCTSASYAEQVPVERGKGVETQVSERWGVNSTSNLLKLTVSF